jgi:hypothetical protein
MILESIKSLISIIPYVLSKLPLGFEGLPGLKNMTPSIFSLKEL